MTALPANHAKDFQASLYAIEDNGKTIFYGTDTAHLTEEVWRAFDQEKMRFDLVVLDHTYGPKEEERDHLNASRLVEHGERMRKEGILKKEGSLLATHIAHEGNPIHPQLVKFASLNGYEVAYDGLSMKI